MTIEENKEDVAFRGLMKSLNLDESRFKIYKTNFNQLTYGQLSTIKNDIETQLSTLFDVLTHYYNADMTTNLLTSEGFPRNDIDVLGIRLIRVRIIRLRNDHKDVLASIEGKLVEHFQSSAASPENNTQPEQSAQPESSVQDAPTIPFARVQEVVPNSPASSSGLQEGDKIVLFDRIHIATSNKLASIAQIVRSNVNQPISVKVVRNNSTVSLQLRPSSNWDGQGLLGCRIVPL